MPPKSVRHLLESQVERQPDKEFLFTEPDRRVFSYSEFDRLVNYAARLLGSAGVKKGDRVGLFLTNRLEYLVFYFACFKTGAWAGPVNALLKSHEVEFILNDSEAMVAVTEPGLYLAIDECSGRLASLRIVILAGTDDLTEAERSQHRARGTVLFDHASALADGDTTPDDAELSPDDEAVIIYTSGTTGKPKGVLLTHGNLTANAEQIARWLALTERDRSLMIMPLFHVNALMTTGLAALAAGASIVLAPRFSASRHWEIIARYGVTYFGSVATMLSLLNHTYPDGVPDPLDISSLRFALCGSAPVPVEVIERFESLFDRPVIEGYGLSESTCRSTFNPLDRRRAGSVGLPIGNEVKVFDSNDCEVGPGEIGEIVLRGPNIMKGYYRNPTATDEAFRSGWFHTGDLGYKDADGFFYIVDRKSDMIIRGGENIYPREIDETLYRHPSVKDAATVGVPDPLYGEEVKSFVVLKDGAQATREELIEFCRAYLADFKCPKKIEILDEIPKGPTGKLLKRELQGK
ncbi:MAG TPA: long-chain fatty acid--CoA ligase [Blastocatellia bacterium]|nr:long-chain fatty acid--CoA ligase [Blastocatellia bacterium]